MAVKVLLCGFNMRGGLLGPDYNHMPASTYIISYYLVGFFSGNHAAFFKHALLSYLPMEGRRWKEGTRPEKAKLLEVPNIQSS